jgi:membrane-bound serine protease (ClpP class)
MRRLLTVLFVLALLAGAAPARAKQARPRVDVVKVSGLIDRVVADYIERSLRKAGAAHAEAVVLQLDSRGGVIPEKDVDRLAQSIRTSPVPVAVWVGQSGAHASGAALALLRAAALRSMAQGSHVAGHAAPEARRLDLVDTVDPTLGDFIVGLDGRTVAHHTLHTAEVVQERGQPRRRPTVAVRFSQLGLLPRLLHTAASPSAAYFLFVAGMALVVFELYTAGVGVAAGTGAVFLVLAAFGLAALPTRPLGAGLLVLGILGYAVDVQAGAPRAWTVIGTIALATGGVVLYHGLSPSFVVMAFVVAGVALFMVAGMPAMVRARFSTPTIGRESMVGELGQALGDLAPQGTVQVRGAPWRARTNRATPIAAGDPVRVVGIDGLLLEVEPTEGAARDYRR